MHRALLLMAGLSVSGPGAIAEPIVVQQTAPAPRTVDRIPDAATATRLASEGRRFSAQQVKELEGRLTNTPDDLPARARLLGYYFATAIRVAGPEATRAARRRHILWVIEHHPENDITMLSEFTIDPAGHSLADAEGYGQARTLWLGQIDRRKGDVRVLLHAARFFQLSDKALALTSLKQALQLAPSDPEIASRLGYAYAISALGITMINNNGLPMSADPAAASGEAAKTAITDLRASSNPVVVAVAGSILSQYGAIASAYTRGAINQDALTEELLLRAAALDPNDPGLPRSLGQFYSLRMLGARTPEERTALARKSLAQAEMVVDRTTGNREAHVYALNAASKVAMDAGAFDKARRFATDLLKLATDRRDNLYGQAFHDGHVALGRVSLEDGEVEQAKAHLLQAGGTPGGGTLTSFGPNMSLAKELADRGERDTVITYLELCRSFWQSPQLNQWIQTLKDGKVPNFGANLTY
jgi:tetratricopeptide (TPR) repeat protein